MPVRLLLGSGLLLVAIGLLTMTTVDATSGWTDADPGLRARRRGIGLVNPPLASTAIGVVPDERSGMASGINTTFRQVGIATGIAGLGAVFQHSVTPRHHGRAARLAGTRARSSRAAHGQLATLLESGEVDPDRRTRSPPRARAALDHAYRVGFTGAFTTIAADRRDGRPGRRRAGVRAGAQPRLRRPHAGTTQPPEPEPLATAAG